MAAVDTARRGPAWDPSMMAGSGELNSFVGVDGVTPGGARRDELHRMEDRFEQLLLLTEALAELTIERLGITVEDLAAKIAEIDARDGTADQRRGRTVATCSTCGAKIPQDRTTCQFCGDPGGPQGPLGTI